MQIRNAFIKLRNSSRVICGKCGAYVLGDTFNMKNHAGYCGFSRTDFTYDFQIGKDTCYLLQAKEDGLHFLILTPEPIKDEKAKNRYLGARWISVFHSVFLRKEKKILQYTKCYLNTYDWFKRIRSQKITALHTSSDGSIINRVFPEIPGIYSLEEFYYAYLYKPLNTNLLFTGNEEKQLLAGAGPGLKHYSGCPVESHSLKEMPLKAGIQGILTNIESFEFKGEMMFKMHLLYDFEQKFNVKSCTYACLANFLTNKATIILGNGVFLCDQEISVKHLLFQTAAKFIVPEEIDEFNRRYPNLHFADYFEQGGTNPLFPVLGPYYHKALELLIGAGCYHYAKELDAFPWILAKEPDSYKNITDLFSVPVKILKKLPYRTLSQKNFVLLGRIYREHPEYFDFPAINHSMISLLLNNFAEPQYLFGGRYRDNRNDIENFEDFSPKEIHTMLKYLFRTNAGYTLYKDYLNLTSLEDERVEGLTPKDLEAAHDRAMVSHRLNLEKYTIEFFRKAVAEPEYLRFTTNQENEENSEDAKTLTAEKTVSGNKAAASANKSKNEAKAARSAGKSKNDGKAANGPELSSEFMVIAPKEATDLVRESANMNNCVRTYIRAVANGSTCIYFLRKCENPDKSYVTIEVRDRRLIQAKAFANSLPDLPTQRFIRRWAKEKGIDVSNCRDIYASSGAA